MNKKSIMAFIEEKEGQSKSQMIASGTLEIIKETEKAYNIRCESNFGTCYIWVPKWIADKKESIYEINYSQIVKWLQSYETRQSIGLKGLIASRSNLCIQEEVEMEEWEIDPDDPEETTKFQNRSLTREEEIIIENAFLNK